MTDGSFKDIEKFETALWEATDNLRANSKLTSSDYFMPVLGVILVSHLKNSHHGCEKSIVAESRDPRRCKNNFDGPHATPKESHTV